MASLWTESARQSHTAFRRLRCEAALTEPTSPSRPRVPPLSGLQRSRDRHSYCTKAHTVAYRYWDHRIRQIRSICSAIRSWARRWGCHVRGGRVQHPLPTRRLSSRFAVRPGLLGNPWLSSCQISRSARDCCRPCADFWPRISTGRGQVGMDARALIYLRILISSVDKAATV
jgi:hypothetical protein